MDKFEFLSLDCLQRSSFASKVSAWFCFPDIAFNLEVGYFQDFKIIEYSASRILFLDTEVYNDIML